MKIIIYCQHVLGVGHFFRTLELARAMETCEVILVTGGGKLDVELPDHVRHIDLPGLMMDENFSGLYSVDPQKSVDDVKCERKQLLMDLIKDQTPDLFLIELYPFGRRAFRFELIPVLDYIKNNQRVNCKVVCSLRDILVEKQDKKKYETRVIDALNLWFDAVLVHSDDKLIKLDDTFFRLDQIKIPLVYTGFVTPVPDPQRVKHIRHTMGLTKKGRLIVASAGGGNVGAPLLKAVVHAFNYYISNLDSSNEEIRLNVYTGPYMGREDKDYLYSLSGPKIRVEEFTDDFISFLGASDLSISMAGYNTCMNIVAANVPSLVWPFSQNHEQKKRAQEIDRFAGPMTILDDHDLEPERLCELMKENLQARSETKHANLNINGAKNTMKWIREQIK